MRPMSERPSPAGEGLSACSLFIRPVQERGDLAPAVDAAGVEGGDCCASGDFILHGPGYWVRIIKEVKFSDGHCYRNIVQCCQNGKIIWGCSDPLLTIPKIPHVSLSCTSMVSQYITFPSIELLGASIVSFTKISA